MRPVSRSIVLAPVFAADFLTIEYSEQQQYLEARWSRPVSSEDFREGMEAITQTVNRHGAVRTLMDYRLAGIPTVSDQGWLIKHLRAATQTTRLKRSARLLSGDLFQHIVSEVIAEKVGLLPYDFRDFASEAFAKHWLFQEEAQEKVDRERCPCR